MSCEKNNLLTPEDRNNTSKAFQRATGDSLLHPPISKPLTDWEQPDFDELDLCMEVTTYIHHWR